MPSKPRTTIATIRPGTRNSWIIKRPEGGATGGKPFAGSVGAGPLALIESMVLLIGSQASGVRGQDSGVRGQTGLVRFIPTCKLLESRRDFCGIIPCP